MHRFYLGQWWGIFYLLLVWTGIPAVIALIEGIVIACTSDEKWDAKYNQGASSGSSGAGIVVVVIVAVFGAIAMLGILAAIAIPGYQDYVNRAKVVAAVAFITQATPLVREYLEVNRQVPASLAMAGVTGELPAMIREVVINQKTGVILVTMQGSAGINEKAFSFTPNADASNHITWQCAGHTLENKTLPTQCR